MPDVWGGTVSNWRVGINAYIDSEDDEGAYVHVECIWGSIGWGFNVKYNTCSVSCDGQVSTLDRSDVVSGYGETVSILVHDHSFYIAKSTSARSIRCAACFTMVDYQAGSAYAEEYITIAAKPAVAPSAPTNLVAKRESDARFTLTWTNNSSTDAPWTSVDMQVQESDGTWGAPTDGSQALSGTASSTTWTYGKTNQSYAFRVRANNATGSSSWVTSDSLLTTPSAPGNVTAVFNASTGAVTLAWTKTATYADSLEIQRSNDNSSWSTLATPSVSTTSYTDSNPPNGTAYYRLRYGCDDLYSSWATSGAVATYTSADYPQVTITAPASPVRDTPVAATWTVTTTDSIKSQKLSVLLNGETVESATPSASARSYNLQLLAFGDGDTGTLVVSATDSRGLETSATWTFSTDWYFPAEPVVVVGYDDAAAVITCTAGTASETAATDHFRIERIEADGTETLIAEEAPAGQTIDATPPFNVLFYYRVTAISARGKETETMVEATLPSKRGAINFTDGTVVSIEYNYTTQENVQTSGTSYDFAGGELPVFYPSGAKTRSTSHSFVVAPTSAAILRRAAAADTDGCVWIRDARGHVWHGHPSWSWSTPIAGRSITASCTLTETEAP